jgi:Tfp pilus assembly protein PilV
MRLRRHSTGDTIVEVLIAMTVVAGVLGASYTVVNRTMANARQAQEHTEALQVANKQTEYIATLAASDSAADLYDDTHTPQFNCADKDSGALVQQPALRNPSSDAEAAYAAGCVSDGPVHYLTAFEYVTPGMASKNYFKVYVTWASVTGHGNDQVTLVYRAYRP